MQWNLPEMAKGPTGVGPYTPLRMTMIHQKRVKKRSKVNGKLI
jgi:hypothetical protein